MRSSARWMLLAPRRAPRPRNCEPARLLFTNSDMDAEVSPANSTKFAGRIEEMA